MLEMTWMTTPMMQAVGLLAPQWTRARLSILIYHRIPLHKDPLLSMGSPDAAAFDWHMALVRRYFNVLPLSQAISRLREDTLPPRALCVTFDDGYADSIHVILPILQRYGITAIFFITTGYLDGGRMWNDSLLEVIRHSPGEQLDLSDYGLGRYPITTLEQKQRCFYELLYQIKQLESAKRGQLVRKIAAPVANKMDVNLMLSSKQVIELYAAGMEIGSHTVTHPILLKQSPETAWSELIESRRILESLIDAPVPFFAYPHGKPGMDYAPEQAALVQKAGYEAAFSTAWGVSTSSSDFWQLPRFTPWDQTRWRFLLRLVNNCRHTAPYTAS